MLAIKNLHAKIGDVPVLCGINLQINAGEVHAIMGPNGAGKSTLSKVIAGHPACEVTSGSVEYTVGFDKVNLLEMEPEERAQAGVFISFQYPLEIPGLVNSEFLRAAFNEISSAQGAAVLDPADFQSLLDEKVNALKIKPELVSRELNVDFSGGEKKRNEILQMAVLRPRIAFLDETDSGLDVDALKTVASGIRSLKSKDNAIVLVTHYHRLLAHVKPDHVHVMMNGSIVKSGGEELAFSVEENGYENL